MRIQPRKPKVWIETIREHDSPSNHTRDKFSTPFFLPIMDFINKMYCWLSINLLSAVVAQLNDRNTLSKNSTLPLIFRKNQGPLLSLPQPPSRCNAYVKAFEIWSFSLRSMHFHLFEKNVDCEISLFKEIKGSFGLLSTIELKRWCRSAIMKIHEARTRKLTRYQSQPLVSPRHGGESALRGETKQRLRRRAQ